MEPWVCVLLTFKICVDTTFTIGDKYVYINHDISEFLFHFISENNCSNKCVTTHHIQGDSDCSIKEEDDSTRTGFHYMLKMSTSVLTFIHSFIHSVFCLTTGSEPPPKRFLHTVRSRASSFKWEYPLLSLRSSSSFLRLLLRLLVTSIPSFIFPSITCFRRQFLRKM